MEFVNGIALHRLIHKFRPVRWPFAARWVVTLLGGLAEIHRSGFVHGDVKPENVMILGPAPGPKVAPDATTAKLLDFGAAKRLDADDQDQEGPVRTFVGTPEYAPPEQWTGQIVPASDIYGLGGALFHMLVGKSPYQRDRRDPYAYRHSHIHDEIPDLRRIYPEVPNDLNLLFRRMMAKNPADRGTADELTGEFWELLLLDGVPKMPGSTPARTPPNPIAAPPKTPPPKPVAKPTRPTEPRNPIYRLVDGTLRVFEWSFLPGYHRPLAGSEPGIGERLAALFRRPLVLLLFILMVGLVIYLALTL
jgi:serine/threonine protein kinase